MKKIVILLYSILFQSAYVLNAAERVLTQEQVKQIKLNNIFLHDVVVNNNFSIELALGAGAGVNARMYTQQELRNLKARYYTQNEYNVIDYLINLNDMYANMSAFMIAANQGNIAMLELLASNGADVSEQVGGYGVTALMHVIGKNDIATAKKIIQMTRPEEINVPEYGNGRTALTIAAMYGREEIVRELLQAPGIDVARTDNFDMTALMRTIQFYSILQYFFDTRMRKAMGRIEGQTFWKEIMHTEENMYLIPWIDPLIPKDSLAPGTLENYVHIVQILIEASPESLTMLNGAGYSALSLAKRLKQKCLLNIPHKLGYYAQHYAIFYITVIELLELALNNVHCDMRYELPVQA